MNAKSNEDSFRLLHSEAGPPDILNAKVEALRQELRTELAEMLDGGLDRLLSQHRELLEAKEALKSLLSADDVADTLGVSRRTVERIIAKGDLTPIWIRNQRRFHPDAVDAYIRKRT